MYQRILTALAKRIKVEYLTIEDLTDRELYIYLDSINCHYFVDQAY